MNSPANNRKRLAMDRCKAEPKNDRRSDGLAFERMLLNYNDMHYAERVGGLNIKGTGRMNLPSTKEF